MKRPRKEKLHLRIKSNKTSFYIVNQSECWKWPNNNEIKLLKEGFEQWKLSLINYKYFMSTENLKQLTL